MYTNLKNHPRWLINSKHIVPLDSCCSGKDRYKHADGSSPNFHWMFPYHYDLKLEDLPGCAVLSGSVGGHIGCKDKDFISNFQIFGEIFLFILGRCQARWQQRLHCRPALRTRHGAGPLDRADGSQRCRPGWGLLPFCRRWPGWGRCSGCPRRPRRFMVCFSRS